MPQILNYLLLIVAASSLALVALTYLEPVVAIWLPRSPASRFWSFFDRLLLTLRYVSAAEEKLSRARFTASGEEREARNVSAN